ncbi:MAG: IS982 family transposase [Puniceicoccales bacterium]|jgi:hypothetical protein|nr:IS982 family transposase [Puniceicoccales bacterium]
MQGFQDILPGVSGEFLRPFFPKMPNYSSFMKQIKRQAKTFHFIGRTRRSKGTFCIDSTPLPVCKNVRHRSHKIFKNMAKWAHSSVSTTFGLKLHLVLNARRKFVKFSLKPGNLHDVSCAEEVLAGCTGTVIGDSGYVPTALRDSLAKKGIRLIAKHRQNMAPNSREEKRFLKKRSIVETMIGKFKSFFGETLSRFRSPQSAYSAICAAIIAFNLGPLF